MKFNSDVYVAINVSKAYQDNVLSVLNNEHLDYEISDCFYNPKNSNVILGEVEHNTLDGIKSGLLASRVPCYISANYSINIHNVNGVFQADCFTVSEAAAYNQLKEVLKELESGMTIEKAKNYIMQKMEALQN